MKKQLKTKLAAIGSAAMFAFTGVQSLTASAATYTTQTQSLLTNTNHMTDFVRAESQKFPNNKYWNNTSNSNGWTNSQCAHHPATNLQQYHASDFPCCGRVAAGNMYYGDYQKINNPGIDGYSFQCAGYAKKVAMDYFQTDCFNQISFTQQTSYQYVPRIGDQMRISGQHTVFVTGVQKLGNYSYRVTYTDCNGVDNQHRCQIKWSRTVTLNRYSGGWGNNAYDVMGFYSSNGTACPVTAVIRPILVGDVNGDSFVDALDYSAMASLLGQSPSYWNSRPMKKAVCDIDKDGKIAYNDFLLLGSFYDGILPNAGYVKGV